MHYKKTKFTCRCGFSIEAVSCSTEDVFSVETCSQCHHAFTKKPKEISKDTKAQKFSKKFGNISEFIK